MTSRDAALHTGENLRFKKFSPSSSEIQSLDEKPPVGNFETGRKKLYKSRQKSWKSIFRRSSSSQSINRLEKSPRRKLTALVNKHFSSLKLLASPKKSCIPDHTNSCPDLADDIKEEHQEQSPKAKYYCISDSRLDLEPSPPKVPREKAHRNHLGVPDIFTTSLRSNKTSVDIETLSPGWPPRNICKSAQNLQSRPLLDRIKLTRSYSDTPSCRTGRHSCSTNSLNISSCLRSRMFKHEHVAQVVDHLFIGSIEAAFNEPLLCKLGIDSLIDMSNVSNMQVPPEKKMLCPCLCPGETPHFRSRLILSIADNDKEDIEQYFHEIDRFIEGARRCEKKVLIFSYFGKSRAPAAAIQYLMTHEGFLLRQAFNLVKNQRPDVSINAGFQRCLEALERRLFPDAKPSVSIYNEYLNVADPQAIKCAWVDC